MNKRDDDYAGLILEELRDQNKAILEILSPMKQMSVDVSELKEDMREVKSDIKAIKAVVKKHNTELTDHQQRITVLETA